MSNAGIDQNSRPTLTALSSANDGSIVTLWADPTTHRLLVDLSGGGDITIGTSAITNGSNGKILYDNNGVIGELTNNFLTSLSGAVLTTTNQSIAGIKTFSDATEATNTTTGGAVISGGLAVAKRVYALDMTVTNTITGSISGNSATATTAPTTAVLVSQASGQTIGDTTNRLTKLWATDITVSNAITGSVTGNAGTVTVAAETGDTSCSVAFVTDVSGSLPIKTNTNLTFNASTGVLTSASAVLTTADINGGTFDNATIGASTPSTIVGTTITANTGLMPDANDGAYIGAAGTAFSDLFLAEGGVINWDSGDLTLTQTGNKLAIAGGDFEINDTNINVGTAVGDKASIVLNSSALNDESWSGTIITAVAGATIAVGDVCYLKTADGQWYPNDGILDGTDTGFKLKLGICVLAANDNGATKMLLDGVIASAAFPTFTVGAPVYLDDTAGDLVVAQPTTTNFAIRVVGEAVSATVLHFHPSNDYIVHV